MHIIMIMHYIDIFKFRRVVVVVCVSRFSQKLERVPILGRQETQNHPPPVTISDQSLIGIYM